MIPKKGDEYDGGEVIHIFPVLYEGWEMDNLGWVVQYRRLVELEGGKKAVLSEYKAFSTSHGSHCEMQASELIEKLAETQFSADAIKYALTLVENAPHTKA